MGESASKYYKRRAEIDLIAQKGLRELVQSFNRRNGIIGSLAESKLDIVDYLERKSKADEATDPMDYLTVRYWSGEVLGLIMREEAVRIWEAIAMEEIEAEDSFENGVLAFTYFKGGLPGKMERLFDEQARLCVVAEMDSIDVIAKEVMGRINAIGVKPAEGNDFHLLDNHFVNLVVDRAAEIVNPPGTLPMTLIAIFCSIARRLSVDLIAKPVGFPGRVLVAMKRRASSDELTFIDVFGQKILTERDKSDLRSNYGDHLDSYLAISKARDMVSTSANSDEMCLCLNFFARVVLSSSE